MLYYVTYIPSDWCSHHSVFVIIIANPAEAQRLISASVATFVSPPVSCGRKRADVASPPGNRRPLCHRARHTVHDCTSTRSTACELGADSIPSSPPAQITQEIATNKFQRMELRAYLLMSLPKKL